MIPYIVSDGVYPFNIMIGVIYYDKDNPEGALQLAIQTYGGHPTVEPVDE